MTPSKSLPDPYGTQKSPRSTLAMRVLSFTLAIGIFSGIYSCGTGASIGPFAPPGVVIEFAVDMTDEKAAKFGSRNGLIFVHNLGNTYGGIVSILYLYKIDRILIPMEITPKDVADSLMSAHPDSINNVTEFSPN
jgi:hypothetical protein